LEGKTKEVLLKGVDDEGQWNKVQSSVQIPNGAGGPQGRGEGHRGPSGLGLRGRSRDRGGVEEALLKGETMERMKVCHVLSITHHSSRVTHHRFHYRSPMEYLVNEGFIPKTLAENGVKSGVFLEMNSFRWKGSLLYRCNMASYLTLLFIQAFILRLKGEQLPWKSFSLILKAVKDGRRGRLGRIKGSL